MSNDPRQYGDGRGEVIPSFDGTDFRQYERRVRLFVSNTRVAPERRAGKLLERLEGRVFDWCEAIQELEAPKGVENLPGHLRIHFESIEVFRRGRVVDDFVCDFEREPGVRATERRHDHGDSLSSRFARECSLASKTVRSVLCPSGRRPRMKRTRKSTSSRKMRLPMTSWRPSIRKQQSP